MSSEPFSLSLTAQTGPCIVAISFDVQREETW
jgi:hypothetical protein